VVVVVLLRLLVALLPAARLPRPRRRRRRKRRSPTRTWASVCSTKQSPVRENEKVLCVGRSTAGGYIGISSCQKPFDARHHGFKRVYIMNLSI
jgi:hypothetical protein